MRTINTIIVTGNLTREPRLDHTESGTPYVRNCVAVDNDRDRDETIFLNFTAWGKTAENIARLCYKGRKVGIQGKLVQSKWTGRDGNEKTGFSINAFNVDFFGKHRAEVDDSIANAAANPLDMRTEGYEQRPRYQQESFDAFAETDVDIPF